MSLPCGQSRGFELGRVPRYVPDGPLTSSPEAERPMRRNPDTPAISVVICTHNRAAWLSRSIESVLQQDMGPDEFEVIVVDNGSTDTTQSVVARYGDRVRYMYEPAIGLSHARNTGWHFARAEVVALLDDDAVAEPGWLAALCSAFAARPAPACVGGRVDPIWEAPRPAWVSDQLALSLTIADWTDTPHAITDLTREWLVGANFAVRRNVLEESGGFVTQLGRTGLHLLSGEEIHLQRRLLKEGQVCWYEPKARVRHLVPASRLQPGWFRRRYRAQGQSDAILWHLENEPTVVATIREARNHVGPLVRAGFGIGGYLRLPGAPEQFIEHCGVLWRLGYLVQLLRMQVRT